MESGVAQIYGDERPATWAEARTYGIGGSEAAAVLGLNPWCSPYALWCRKSGLTKPIEQTEVMRWGHRLEDAITAYYAEAEVAEIWRAHDWERKLYQRDDASFESYADGTLFRSMHRPWQLASVDRLVTHPKRGFGGLECKNVGFRMRGHWDDGVPAYVQAQCDHYMAVTGLTWWAVAVLFEGRDPGWSVVERDEDRIAHLVATESAFWESLERGEVPPQDGSESTRGALAEVYPRPEAGQVVALPDEALAWDAAYVEHKTQEKFHEAKARGFETLIRAVIGSAEDGSLANGATWHSYTYPAVDVEAHTKKAHRRYSRRAPQVSR